MTHARRTPMALLAAALVALCLVGQVAAVAPARAAQAPIPAKAGETSDQAAGSAVATRRAATLTLEAPLAAPAIQQATSLTSTRDGWSVLMTEGFEGIWPPVGGLWTTRDDNGPTGGEVYWDDANWPTGVHTGSRSAWPARGGANGLDPNSYFYPNDMSSWMVYGPFDLTGYSAANLDFWYWNQSELDHDLFFWGRSGDGTNFAGTQVSGDSLGWQHVTLDLSAHLDDSSVWVAFVFQSNSTNMDDGPFVDDITLNAYSGVAPVRDWTYMVYLDGDNNLESAAVNDFLEMSGVGSTPQVAVVAQMDRITGYSIDYGDWTDTRRFLITPGMTPIAANGTSIGEQNMGDPATLVDFVQWATTTYPANHYALILWDHGSGWRSRALDEPIIQSIASDDSSSGASLDMAELRNALSTMTGGGANPFELLGMDACLMAMIEVDNQIRPYADVRVTSQEIEPNDGAPLDAILAALVANPAITTDALATVYVDQYYASYGNDGTQSAADLGADYAALNTAVDNFAAALLANGAANAAGIQAARSAVQEFDFDYYIDLYDFATRVSSNVANTAIDNAAAAVMAALGPATIHEHHGDNLARRPRHQHLLPRGLRGVRLPLRRQFRVPAVHRRHAVGRVGPRLLRLRDRAGHPRQVGPGGRGHRGVPEPDPVVAGRDRHPLVRVLLRHHRQRRLRPHQLDGQRDGDERRPHRAGSQHHLLLAGVRFDQLHSDLRRRRRVVVVHHRGAGAAGDDLPFGGRLRRLGAGAG